VLLGDWLSVVQLEIAIAGVSEHENMASEMLALLMRWASMNSSCISPLFQFPSLQI